jgi:hypothetical protein
MCFDLLGRQNLMLVHHAGDYRLCIADTGVFKFDVVEQKHPGTLVKIEKRMDRLNHLYRLAKAI